MGQVTYPVTIDGVDLNTISGLTVLSTNPYVYPKRTLGTNLLARSNSSKITTGFYTDRQITVSVQISQPTRPMLESSIDALAGLIQGLEKELILGQGGTLRKYIVTYSDSIVGLSGGSYIQLSLVFMCSDRYGYSLQYEKLLDATARSLYNYTDTFTLNGSATTQTPVITAFISALTGATTNTVTIKNVVTNQGISVSRAWTAGDRLIIDTYNKTVTVNGSAVDYTGGFPEFALGVGYLNYQDNFKTRTLALAAYYYRRYL